jgi:type I restriction enzyme S subunit
MRGELKPGYKQTEVGVVPEDWEVKQIGDLQPFVTSGSRGWAAFYSDRGAPFIRITNLSRASIYLDLEDLRLVNLTKNDSEAARTQLQDGDILISITADIGIIGYVSVRIPKPAYINQHIALMRFDPLQTNSKFVSYFLASERPQKLFRALTDSGAKAGMNLTTVQQIRLALPPSRAEQEAIAESLSDADALIESLEQLIAKKRQTKQGAMQELLTGKKRLPGFATKPGYKQTEVGVIPEDWEVRPLVGLASILHGYGFQSQYFKPHGTYRLTTPGHFHETGGFRDVGDKQKFYDGPLPDGYLLSDGDLIVVMTEQADGLLGSAALVPPGGSYLHNQRLGKVKLLSPNVSSKFLYRVFNSRGYRAKVRETAAGTKVKHTSPFKLLEIPVTLPPTLAEQEAIATILTDMDAEIAALEGKLAKARQLKLGMMQELLTGRIRLV